ncbi:hypothetical protein ACFPTX_00920 [Pseudomonas sp. GCM10022188]|uniref:hypothetical protein n=1 Tax=Pseudomonas TaxID=286 RepID=UPI001E530260|nr:hypothetical protein [Pseudomonas oryzagri]MCC6075164.1 hypothetical protein [Pseudomonas oryzagri]
MWKFTLFLSALFFLPAHATIYTNELDPEYQKITRAIVCMNHFYNRSSSFLGHQAGMAAQKSLELLLASLENKEKIADAIRMATMAINKRQNGSEVPFTCYDYIPKEHGLTKDEIEHFMLHSTDK